MVSKRLIILSIVPTLALLTKNRTMMLKCHPLRHSLHSTRNNVDSIRFKSSLVSSTRMVPKPKHDSVLMLRNFFSKRNHVNLLLVGRGNMKIIKPSKPLNSSQLLGRWEEELKYFHEDCEEQGIIEKNFTSMSVRTPFLVFTIIAEVIVGVQIMAPRHASKSHPGYDPGFSPMYQVVLLEEAFHADGPPPLVWLFDKLTAEKSNHTKHVLFEVWAVEKSPRELAFVAQTKADFSFNFPAILLQFLPRSKDFLENLGNAALSSSMKEDVNRGLDMFLQSYLNGLKRS